MDSPHPWRGIRPWKRHSLVLMVAGLVYIGVGVSFIMAQPTQGRGVALYFAYLIMPLKGWGLVWITAGLMSIISSRWPPISETWGYTVLTGLASGWAAFYAVGIIFGESPNTNVSGVLVWGLVGFMWWAISGLLNPPAVVVVVSSAEEVEHILHGSNARESDVFLNHDSYVEPTHSEGTDK